MLAHARGELGERRVARRFAALDRVERAREAVQARRAATAAARRLRRRCRRRRARSGRSRRRRRGSAPGAAPRRQGSFRSDRPTSDDSVSSVGESGASRCAARPAPLDSGGPDPGSSYTSRFGAAPAAGVRRAARARAAARPPRRDGDRSARPKLRADPRDLRAAPVHAKVAELVDAPALGAGGATRGGSSPPFRTTRQRTTNARERIRIGKGFLSHANHTRNARRTRTPAERRRADRRHRRRSPEAPARGSRGPSRSQDSGPARCRCGCSPSNTVRRCART